MPTGEHLYKQFKASNPTFNVRLRPQPLATETVFSDTAAVDSGGIRIAQIFYGTTSHVTDVFDLKQEKHFVNYFDDVTRKRGAPINSSATVQELKSANKHWI